jgi:hypothetical protein
MLTVRSYDESLDYEMLIAWLAPRNQWYPKDWFSNYGFIVENLGVGAAAGFLYLTNSGRAYIEDFITNPEAELEDRSEAIDLLVYTIEKTAKHLGFKYLIGASYHSGIIAKAKRHGFNVSAKPFTLVVKNL